MNPHNRNLDRFKVCILGLLLFVTVSFLTKVHANKLIMRLKLVGSCKFSI